MARFGLKMEGVEKVNASLRARSLKGAKKATVNVAYETPYAVYVHEDLEANHPNGGQAKFLEEPFRANRNLLSAIVKRSLVRKRSLEDGLMEAGNLLLNLSIPLVPVDTGRLRDSGNVTIVKHNFSL